MELHFRQFKCDPSSNVILKVRYFLFQWFYSQIAHIRRLFVFVIVYLSKIM